MSFFDSRAINAAKLLLIKRLSRKFSDLKFHSGTSRSLYFKLSSKSKVKRAEIMTEILLLDEKLIDYWSLYHCSLDEVFFSIIRRFSPAQAFQRQLSR